MHADSEARSGRWTRFDAFSLANQAACMPQGTGSCCRTRAACGPFEVVMIVYNKRPAYGSGCFACGNTATEQLSFSRPSPRNGYNGRERGYAKEEEEEEEKEKEETKKKPPSSRQRKLLMRGG